MFNSGKTLFVLMIYEYFWYYKILIIELSMLVDKKQNVVNGYIVSMYDFFDITSSDLYKIFYLECHICYFSCISDWIWSKCWWSYRTGLYLSIKILQNHHWILYFKNLMEESLALFRVILSSDYFCNASVILFLNKTDLFPERLAGKPLRYTYPDFDGNFTIKLFD